MKRLACIVLMAFSVMWLAPQAAQASPLTYTQIHCVKFARAVNAERWAAGVTQVRYLSRPYTLNSVERYADAWLYNQSNAALRGLVNGCYNVVVYN